MVNLTKKEHANVRRGIVADIADRKLRTRCRNIVRHQIERAAKLNLSPPDYTGEQLYEVVKLQIGAPCRYCGKKITVKNFEIDHGLPLSRGGNYSLSNTNVDDSACNKKKGSLTVDEFLQLLAFLSNFENAARADVLTRLGIGGQWKR